jgi:signal peptidase I
MSSTTIARHRAAAPVARSTVAAPVGRRSLARRILSLLGNVLMAGCALVFIGLAVGPHLFDYQTSTMLTGSMDPYIEPGDVVVTKPMPAEDIQVGDVISYQIPVEDHRVETHRVVSVERAADGSIAIETKGDANENKDPWVAVLDTDTVYEVQTVVPELGTAIRVLRAPVVQHGILWVALGGALVLGLSTIWGKKTDDETEPREQA